jgi:2-polyprenyl-3-methyl-5-hydroxy-6-metoxy-1,4-benzoquinol methylase
MRDSTKKMIECEFFWNQQIVPLHREDTHEHYCRFAKELALLLSDREFCTVLEIGCGNGALFEPLGFSKTEYTGVDFSDTMISVFHMRHPQARLIVARGEEYCDKKKYDLIFCNAVAQYFTKSMFTRFLRNASAMLADDGWLIIASIPWRSAYLRYHTGELGGQTPPAWRAALRILRSLCSSTIGSWYSIREVNRLGRAHGFRTEVFGSVHYCYRFHVRMRRQRRR